MPASAGLPNLDLSNADSASVRFLASSLEALPDTVPIALRFLFPATSGSVVRSDFLQQRLEYCEHIAGVASFLSPLQWVNAVPYRDVTPLNLGEILCKAIGALRLHPSATFHDAAGALRNRLSWPWLVATPLRLRRIAWVQGREDIESIGRALEAAFALGIKLVVMDEPGHWLQCPEAPWAHLREAFVAVDISPDAGFAQRVADAVRAYPEAIDGVVTISDVRLPGVAAACQMLNLPTESPAAYAAAGNKGRTRMLEPAGDAESVVVTHADDLKTALEQRRRMGQPPLAFPLVVKPVIGWCSDCVSKVRNAAELAAAVQKASDRHAGAAAPSTAVVVEPYVDGPEVDANFALLDGKILFFDVSDDFPSPGDMAGAGAHANFQETQNVMPSALPAREIAALRDHIQASLLRQGFRTGVFHCEARVRNSQARYGVQDGGVLDLEPKQECPAPEEPQVYLHEINARPPGYLESLAVLLAYGVDYYALRMLMAIGPAEATRVRALAQPFLNGSQFHLSVMIIQQTRAGVMKSADAAKEFLEKHPQFRDRVVDYYTRKKAGDVLEGPDASALWWIAYFSVISRRSRRDLLEQVNYIQENFEYETEDGRT